MHLLFARLLQFSDAALLRLRFMVAVVFKVRSGAIPARRGSAGS